MTFVGKIFTVLIFIMSLVFMSFSVMVVATHKVWKEEVTGQPDGLRARLQALNTKIKDLEALRLELKAEIERERVQRAHAIADLNSKNQALTRSLQTAESSLQDEKTKNVAAVAAAESATQALAKVTSDNEKLRENIRTAQLDRDTQFSLVVEKTDQIQAAESKARNLEERRDQLAQEVTSMKKVMDAKGLTINSLTDHIAPVVDGFITAISNKDANLIEISIGSDDGLRTGHQLDIYRDRLYLGRIIINKTSPNRAVGRVVKELLRGQIKKNDRVTTKFG